MKKFLSLVLALVMTMSLVTISAGAKDFADDDSIDYKEAVDVISAIGIVNGYSDGSFGPDGALTRGAAAKIICNLILGPTTASALRATTAPFKDVPTNNVFAGYITYCAQQGIISGYGDGTFRPTGSLTGNAFMKMLLGALGYSSAKEGYTGANWQINVIKQAVNIGLDNGNDSFVGSNNVTRQEAALYAFNMLQADMVEYPDDTTITAGDITITTQGTFKSVQWGSSADEDGNIADDGYVQFAERYFNKLVKTAGTTDDFARPATKWTWKGSAIGTYAETANVVYDDDVKLGQIYADLGMTEKDNRAEVYVDGVQADSNANVSKGNDAKVSDVTFSGSTGCDVGKGTRIEAFRDANTNDVTIVCINYYPAKVNLVAAATASKDAYITLNPLGANPTGWGVGGREEFTTDDFETDEVVYFTFADGDIQSVTAAESVEGNLSRKVTGKSITLGGDSEYKFSNKYAVGDPLNIGSDYIVYLDPAGNAIYVEESEYNIQDYMFLRALQGSTTAFQDDKAAVLTYEGKFATLNTNKDYKSDFAGYGSSTLTPGHGNIVLARETSSGDYRLKDATTNNILVSDNIGANTKTGFNMENGVAAITVNGSTLYADSKTVIVLGTYDSGKTPTPETAADADYTVYTGAKAMPDVIRNNVAAGSGSANAVEATYYSKSGNGVITIMYMTVDTKYYSVTGGDNDVIFLAAESASKTIEDANNTYYEFNGVINGEIVEGIMLDADTYAQVMGDLVGGATGDVFDKVYKGARYDDGVIVDLQDLTGASINTSGTVKGINKLNNENIVLGYGGVSANTYVVSEDVEVYFIDDDGDITVGTIGGVARSTDDYVTYVIDSNGQISHLFIQQWLESGTADGGTTPAALGSIAVGNTGGTPNRLVIQAYDNAASPAVLANTTLTVTVSQNSSGVSYDLGSYTVTTDASGRATLPIQIASGWNYTVRCGQVIGNL